MHYEKSLLVVSDNWDISSDISLIFRLLIVYYKEVIAVGICVAVIFALLFLGLHPKASEVVGALPPHVNLFLVTIEMDKILHCSAFAILFFVGYTGLDFLVIYIHHFLEVSTVSFKYLKSHSALAPPIHSYRRLPRPVSMFRIGLISYMIMLGLAVGSEFLQNIIAPWRSFDYYDICANTIGSTLGFLLFLAIIDYKGWV